MRALVDVAFMLLLVLLTFCFAEPFKCSSSGKSCDAVVDFIPRNATTFLDIKNLFDVSSLLALRGANNLPLSYPRNSTVAADEKIRIPFRCACNNGTGLSDRQPMYKVAANESLYGIAAEVFAGLVTFQQLQEANNISDPGLIKLGDILWVPLPCSCDDVEGQDVVHYGHVVAPGSTLGGIAQQYNVSQNTLLAFNNLSNAKDLKAGAVLDVPLRVCTSMVSNASLDYPLILPTDTYTRTATDCIICNCSAINNWVLQCKPSSVNTSCSPIRCVGEEDNLYIGDTTSSGCNHTTCAYAGYTDKRILTAIALESTCPASSDESPSGSSGARELKFSLLVSIYEVVFYLVVLWCI